MSASQLTESSQRVISQVSAAGSQSTVHVPDPGHSIEQSPSHSTSHPPEPEHTMALSCPTVARHSPDPGQLTSHPASQMKSQSPDPEQVRSQSETQSTVQSPEPGQSHSEPRHSTSPLVPASSRGPPQAEPTKARSAAGRRSMPRRRAVGRLEVKIVCMVATLRGRIMNVNADARRMGFPQASASAQFDSHPSWRTICSNASCLPRVSRLRQRL